MRSQHWLSLVVLFCLSAPVVAAGPMTYTASDFGTLVAAINQANANAGNDTIILAPNIYGDRTVPLPAITDNLTLQGPQDRSAYLNTKPTDDKGLLTINSGLPTSVDLRVSGITFENASISPGLGGNAAGIRDQSMGGLLSVSNSTFLNNQNGILTGSGPAQNETLSITVFNSLFANNGRSGQEHGIYAYGQSLTVSGSTFCGTILGHDIKSRTAVTSVMNSTLYDGAAAAFAICNVGSTSYAIDAPNGGQLSVDGVEFVQGNTTDNIAIISYGEEGLLYANNSLSVSNSAFTSTINGRAVQEVTNGAFTCLAPVRLSNTTFSPTLTPVSPVGCSNTVITDPPVPVGEPPTIWTLLAALLGGALLWRKSRAPRCLHAQ